MNAKEWSQLWHSLSEEERQAVVTMKRRAIEWREQEFYEAKAKRDAAEKKT